MYWYRNTLIKISVSEIYDKIKKTIRNATHSTKIYHWKRFAKILRKSITWFLPITKRNVVIYNREQRRNESNWTSKIYRNKQSWIDHSKRLYLEDQPTQRKPETTEITIDEKIKISTVEGDETHKNRNATAKDGIVIELVIYLGIILHFINKLLQHNNVPNAKLTMRTNKNITWAWTSSLPKKEIMHIRNITYKTNPVKTGLI